jgi:hypothetical protein
VRADFAGAVQHSSVAEHDDRVGRVERGEPCGIASVERVHERGAHGGELGRGRAHPLLHPGDDLRVRRRGREHQGADDQGQSACHGVFSQLAGKQVSTPGAGARSVLGGKPPSARVFAGAGPTL